MFFLCVFDHYLFIFFSSSYKIFNYLLEDGLYDCCWCEDSESILISVSGDGTIKVWDTSSVDNPRKSYEEHSKEIYSVDYNLVGKETFITGSWDNTIKLWSLPEDVSLQTYDEHSYCVYSTIWSPSSNDVFASASGDNTCKIWNVNDASSTLTLKAHNNEILTCDWNKYNENILVIGSVDRTIKIWDLRNPKQETSTLQGHSYAVRRLKCSPHDENIIASCS